jgi:hypothetical protein
VWERPPSREEVHKAVEEVFDRFDVVAMYVYPARWQAEADEWAARFGQERVLRFPWNSAARTAPAVDRFVTMIAEGQLTHSDSPVLTAHVLNAILKEQRGNLLLDRAGPGRPIDACVAAVMALQAHADQSLPELDPVMYIPLDANLDELFDRAKGVSRPKPSITPGGDRGWHPVL